MKKSNILLLSGFILSIIFISAINLSIYANYKRGNYTIFVDDATVRPDAMQSLPGIRVVSIRDLKNTDIEFADVMQVEKDTIAYRYTTLGDSITFSPGNSNRNERHRRNLIVVPYSAQLHLYNSTVAFTGSGVEWSKTSAITLHRSGAEFLGKPNSLNIDRLDIIGLDSSTVSIGKNTRVKQLQLQLETSTLNETGGMIDSLSIATDSLSKISLQTKHLLKATITTRSN